MHSYNILLRKSFAVHCSHFFAGLCRVLCKFSLRYWYKYCCVIIIIVIEIDLMMMIQLLIVVESEVALPSHGNFAIFIMEMKNM